MTTSPHAERPAGSGSDKVDLKELLRIVEPYTRGDELAIAGFYEIDQEQAEFVAWNRAEREK